MGVEQAGERHTTKCWKSQAFMSWVAVRARTPRLFLPLPAADAEPETLDRCDADACLLLEPACDSLLAFMCRADEPIPTGAPTQPTPTPTPTPTDEAPERSAAGDCAIPSGSESDSAPAFAPAR